MNDSSTRRAHDTPPVTDVHAHVVLESSLGAAGVAGPELGMTPDGTPFYRVGEYVLRGVRYAGSPFMDTEVRLAEMDRAGIDRQMLSPNPLTYFTDLDAASAARYCRTHNDALAETVHSHPDRLLGAAQMPLADVDTAVVELERSVRELGLVAPYIDTDPGRRLDDPAMDDFWAAAVDLNVPVFVHPTPVGSSGPPDDERLRRFDLDLLFGFAYDETLAVAALIFGGVLDRHPDLDVCLSHGGGALAYVAGRLARAVEVRRPWVSDEIHERGLDPYLQRLWLDTHVHSAAAFDLLVEIAGPDRLVLGTNFAGWDSGAGAIDHVGAFADRLATNAERLLRLGGTADHSGG